jgi:hypothetical protein
MRDSDQRTPRAAAEKVSAQQRRRLTPGTGGAIRGPRCGAVAGTSMHAPMT